MLGRYARHFPRDRSKREHLSPSLGQHAKHLRME